MKRGTVIVMGGTFDPPHRWHVRGAVLARRRAASQAWLLFVPAARNPLKAQGPVASDAERVAMLGLALKGVAKSAVWTDEVDRAAALALRGATKPSYTIDTLRRLRLALPAGVTLRLLIGGDQAAGFHRWKSARAVVRLAEPLVMPRGAIVSAVDLRAALRESGFWRESEIARWGERLVDVPVADIASTAVRAGGEDGMLAAGVRRFVCSRGLYGR